MLTPSGPVNVLCFDPGTGFASHSIQMQSRYNTVGWRVSFGVDQPFGGFRRKTWNLPIALALCCFALIACSDSDNPLDAAQDAPADTTTTPPPDPGNILADHFAAAEFSAIPDTILSAVESDLRIYYGHTSHGSQLMTGLGMVRSEDPKYVRPHIQETSGDLGHNGSLGWESTTRTFLASNADDYNVVMWSWCGGCSDNTDEGIDIYLAAMNQLELDFPDIVFVYMTGHLDGSGIDGVLYRSNNRIRDYCDANDKVLFDFADIESYDPDGVYYPDETDSCGWCSDWCDSYDCSGCGSCAHSHCFNCYQKGKAFWWMMARVVGWGGH